jgi:hypothetical protein
VARISGANQAITYSSTQLGTYSSLGCFNQISVNRTRDRFESTCGGDTNKTYVLGKKDFSGTATAVFDTDSDAIWTAADSATPLFYKVYPDLTNYSSVLFNGQMYIDASMDIPLAGIVTVGVNFAAAGDVAYSTTGGPSASTSPSASSSPS